MAPDPITTIPVARSSFEWDYEYDKESDVFLFYPSRPAFESSRNGIVSPYPTGFYNLPVFRNDRDNLPLRLRPAESVYSDETAVTYIDEDFFGREGDILRSMGYSRCLCLGLVSIGVPNWLHSATAQDSTPSPAGVRLPFIISNFFAKLWNRLLRH